MFANLNTSLVKMKETGFCFCLEGGNPISRSNLKAFETELMSSFVRCEVLLNHTNGKYPEVDKYRLNRDGPFP